MKYLIFFLFYSIFSSADACRYADTEITLKSSQDGVYPKNLVVKEGSNVCLKFKSTHGRRVLFIPQYNAFLDSAGESVQYNFFTYETGSFQVNCPKCIDKEAVTIQVLSKSDYTEKENKYVEEDMIRNQFKARTKESAPSYNEDNEYFMKYERMKNNR